MWGDVPPLPPPPRLHRSEPRSAPRPPGATGLPGPSRTARSGRTAPRLPAAGMSPEQGPRGFPSSRLGRRVPAGPWPAAGQTTEQSRCATGAAGSPAAARAARSPAPRSLGEKRARRPRPWRSAQRQQDAAARSRSTPPRRSRLPCRLQLPPAAAGVSFEKKEKSQDSVAVLEVADVSCRMRSPRLHPLSGISKLGRVLSGAFPC